MRRPTSREEAYAWHANALKGVYSAEPIEYNPDDPKPGWYQRRLVKGGVYVPVRIWLHADVDIGTGELEAPEELRCEVNGERVDAQEQWSHVCHRPISESEFAYLTELAAFVRVHEPNHPLANPTKPVDWLAAPVTLKKEPQHG